jgi:hypothetical protein
VKRGSSYELVLNLVEVTIPWNDVEIYEGKFDKSSDLQYVFKPFKKGDIKSNTLDAARGKKIDK